MAKKTEMPSVKSNMAKKNMKKECPALCFLFRFFFLIIIYVFWFITTLYVHKTDSFYLWEKINNSPKQTQNNHIRINDAHTRKWMNEWKNNCIDKIGGNRSKLIMTSTHTHTWTHKHTATIDDNDKLIKIQMEKFNFLH